MQGRYPLYTDNLTHYKGHAPFSALAASWAGVLSLTDRFALIPSLYGRVLIGKNIPYPYLNAMGGENFGHYLPQQLPFAGITNLEIVDNSVLVTSLKLRQRIGSKNYVTFTGNVAFRNDNFLISGEQNRFGAVVWDMVTIVCSVRSRLLWDTPADLIRWGFM